MSESHAPLNPVTPVTAICTLLILFEVLGLAAEESADQFTKDPPYLIGGHMNGLHVNLPTSLKFIFLCMMKHDLKSRTAAVIQSSSRSP